jgi:hypothetical protein
MFELNSIVEVAGHKYMVIGTYQGDEELTLVRVVPDTRIQAIVDAWNNFTSYNSNGDENRCEEDGQICDCVNEKTVKIILDAIDKLEA